MSCQLWKLPLLLVSMMTMMSGAIVAPSLPQIAQRFDTLEQIELLSHLVITLPALFVAVFSPLFGYHIDKFGRKRALLFSLLLYGAAGVSGAIVDDLYLILVGRVFLGISVAGIMTISTALVGDYFQGHERNRFMGLQGAFVGFGGVILIAVAGVLADFHWQAPFFIYLLAIPIFLTVKVYLWEPERVGPAMSEITMASGSSFPRGIVMLVLGTVFVGVIFFYMIPVQIPFLIRTIDGTTNAMAGYVISLFTFSSSLVSLYYGVYRRYLSFSSIYGIAFTLMGIGYIGVSYCSTYGLYLLAIAFSGLGLGLFIPTGNLWIMAITPPHLRGRFMGRSSMAFFLGMFVSPLVVQPFTSLFSNSQVFRLAGGTMIAMAVFFLVAARPLSSSKTTAS